MLPALAADSVVAGDWLYRMETPNGEVTADMKLKVDGFKLTGVISFGGETKLDIEEGSVDGNKLKFTLKRQRSQGGTMTYKMAAAVEGAKMTGSAETEIDGQPQTITWSATRK